MDNRKIANKRFRLFVNRYNIRYTNELQGCSKTKRQKDDGAISSNASSTSLRFTS